MKGNDGAIFAGYLSLLVNQMWREQWCCLCQGALHFYHDKGDARTSMPSLPLYGCEVVPGLGPKHPFAFRILRNNTEMAALEVKLGLSLITAFRNLHSADLLSVSG